jgi:hypothetical protein
MVWGPGWGGDYLLCLMVGNTPSIVVVKMGVCRTLSGPNKAKKASKNKACIKLDRKVRHHVLTFPLGFNCIDLTLRSD